jgi:hypothetical protein
VSCGLAPGRYNMTRDSRHTSRNLWGVIAGNSTRNPHMCATYVLTYLGRFPSSFARHQSHEAQVLSSWAHRPPFYGTSKCYQGGGGDTCRAAPLFSFPGQSTRSSRASGVDMAHPVLRGGLRDRCKFKRESDERKHAVSLTRGFAGWHSTDGSRYIPHTAVGIRYHSFEARFCERMDCKQFQV